jgi:hypothetical protein
MPADPPTQTVREPSEFDITDPMLQSFLSTTLPVVVAVLYGTWSTNKRLDAVSIRLNRIEKLLSHIEALARHSRAAS